MKRILTGLILAIYLISSVIAVLAAPASVDLTMAPEASKTALLGDDLVFSLSNWPYLLLIPLPLLAWILMFRRILILVPEEEGRYKVVGRKIARRRDKKWFVNVGKELSEHLAEYGQIVVDFRGGFLKQADKSVYAGEFLLGASDLRYARISSRRFTSWTASLKKKKILAVGQAEGLLLIEQQRYRDRINI